MELLVKNVNTYVIVRTTVIVIRKMELVGLRDVQQGTKELTVRIVSILFFFSFVNYIKIGLF